MKNKWRKITQILVTTVLLLWVLQKSGLFKQDGRTAFLNVLAGANYYYLLGSILLSFILNLSSAIKWQMLLTARHKKVSLFRTYCYYSIGKFYNLILPSSMGGDIIRIMLMGNHTEDKATVAASVLVERFTGMISLMLFAILAVVLNLNQFNERWLNLSLAVGSFLIAFLIWLTLDSRIYGFFSGKMKKKLPFLENPLHKIEKIRKAIFEYQHDQRAIFWAFLNSILFQFLAVINVWVAIRVFSDSVNLSTCLTLVPIVMFIMNIPISIGGIGLMEFGYVFTFSALSLPSDLAFPTALLMRAKSILDAVIGGIISVLLSEHDININSAVKGKSV